MRTMLDHLAPGRRRSCSAVVAAIALLVLLVPRPAAGGSELAPIIALRTERHCTVKAPGLRLLEWPCDCLDYPLVSCSGYPVTYPLFSPADIWVIAARGDPEDGIAALSFTIEFEGDGLSPPLGIYSWTLCADAGTPTVSWYQGNPGTGYSIHWDAETNCQRSMIGSDGVHAVAGCFYVYAYEDCVFRVPAPEPGRPVSFSVTDCDGNETVPDQQAPVVGFGGATGYNPCAEDVPVAGTTWGRLKTQY